VLGRQRCESVKTSALYFLSVNLKPNKTMLYTLALILIILWLLGLVSGYTMGNFIYILLVVAIIMILVRLIQGRKI
jgi:low affinity Fe/Cu permease